MFRSRSLRRFVLLCLLVVPVPLLLTSCGGGGPVQDVLALLFGGKVLLHKDQPAAGAQVTLEREDTTESTTTNANGQFSFSAAGPIPAGSRIIVTGSDEGQFVYSVLTPANVTGTDNLFSLDPFSAEPKTPGLDVVPSVAKPAGRAVITSPRSGDTVTFDQGVDQDARGAFGRFTVRGTADEGLSAMKDYYLYVVVHPTSPTAEFFPQYLIASVDPGTGAWVTMTQFGPPAQEGYRYELLVVVTAQKLEVRPPLDPLKYPRALDIPGVVYLSPFVTDLTAGAMTP